MVCRDAGCFPERYGQAAESVHRAYRVGRVRQLPVAGMGLCRIITVQRPMPASRPRRRSSAEAILVLHPDEPYDGEADTVSA